MSIQLAVLSAFVRALGDAAVSNGIASGSVKVFTDLGAALLDRGSEAESELQLLTSDIQTMVSEDREPTSLEWADMQARSDAAHSIIQNWRPS